MRITGGRVKGRILSSPKGLSVRPSSDRVREAVFNVLGQDLSGLKVLDLFAGTGSLGLEALSRGAEKAVFIDSLQPAIQVIKKNLELCGYGPRGVVIRRDLTKGIPWGHSLVGEEFDLVFADPPYRRNLISPLIEDLSGPNRISPDGLVVVESFKTEELATFFGELKLRDTRTYGDTRIWIYRAWTKSIG